MEITKANYHQYTIKNADLVLMATDNITRIDYVHPEAKNMNLARNPIREITCELPKGLHTLILTNTDIQSLPELPDSLLRLDLRGTKLSNDFYVSKEAVDRFRNKMKINNYLKLI